MSWRSLILSALAATWLVTITTSPSNADETLAAGLAAVEPVFARYCLDCHAGAEAEGDVDLASLTDLAAFRGQPKLVQRIEELVRSEQMPPPDAEQPTMADREALGGWLRAFLSAEARAHAGDPGRVVLRRLNNAEYTHTIRDLTGIGSLDPAKEFPADGGAGEGFTNTGQSLVMSPALFAKYLAAAKRVADHVVLLPDGIGFHSGSSQREAVADRLARLKAFYARYTQPLAEGARAAQATVKQGVRLDLGSEGFLPVEPYLRATLDLKVRPEVDPATITALAHDRGLAPRYLATLWQTLSAPDSGSALLDQIRDRWRQAMPADAAALAEEIGRWQDALWTFNAVGQIGRHLGRQDGPAGWQEPVSPLEQGQEQKSRITIPPEWDRDSRPFDEFRQLFPKAVCYARIVPVDEVVTLNLYYREDEQLCRLMLDDDARTELDRLWDELLFVAEEPLVLTDAFVQIQAFATQDRPDLVKSFAPMKPVIEARAEAFRQRLLAAEPKQLDAAVAFAGRAFRRPLESADEARLRGLYDALQNQGMPHREAICGVIAQVLVSADFLYKLELAPPGTEPQPVSGPELATRLSYFLWSSLPDAELLAAAEAGQLADPAVIRSQARRLLAAPASRQLAEQFGLQWLHVSGFSSLDEKNAELFPSFASLRADMEEETVRFLDDFFRNDRSILSLIDADHTFLNERLAAHYGIDGVTGAQWRRVDGVRRHGRGSILGLATTLSTQAGASRTSPILRGNWLYETILGEKLPKPPKDVPLLAETVPAGLTERQLIALHSKDEACGRCHRRIDPYGFALEEFDAIGRHRTTAAAGEPLDTRATLPDGMTLDGQQSLRAYLLGPRREQLVRVFCRKLLGYALGRGVQLSDEPLLDAMLGQLAANDYRISVAIDAIVTSPQFTMIRGRDAADEI